MVGGITSPQEGYYASGKLTYAVVKVLKYSNRGGVNIATLFNQ